MNSGELGDMVRGNARIAEKIKALEQEIADRQAQIKVLNAQLREPETAQGRVKVTEGVCISVKDFAARGHSYREIAKLFGIGLTTVSLIVANKYRTKRLRQGREGV